MRNSLGESGLFAVRTAYSNILELLEQIAPESDDDGSRFTPEVNEMLAGLFAAIIERDGDLTNAKEG